MKYKIKIDTPNTKNIVNETKEFNSTLEALSYSMNKVLTETGSLDTESIEIIEVKDGN